MEDEQKQKKQPRARRNFTDEFKASAVAHVRKGGKSVTRVAKDLDLTPSALGKWVEQARADAGKSARGTLTTEEKEELARLLKEVRGRDDRLARFQVDSDMDAGLLVDVRVKFAVMETQATNDYVRVTQDGGTTPVVTSGMTSGPQRTSWLALKPSETSKFVNVDFVSNSDGTQGPGVVAESFEYRRYQSGVANPFFTNLRFPGQYHDVESDLFENWNRYYDPFTGRYIQPEPMLQNARYVARKGRSGRSLAIFSYAGNNPVRWFDATGLDVQNNSSDGVWIAGEQGEQYYLAPGDTYYGPQDGVYTPDGVFKTNNGVNAVINPDGTVSSFGGPAASQAAQAAGESGVAGALPARAGDKFGGPKDSSFLPRNPNWPANPASNQSSGSKCGN